MWTSRQSLCNRLDLSTCLSDYVNQTWGYHDALADVAGTLTGDVKSLEILEKLKGQIESANAFLLKVEEQITKVWEKLQSSSAMVSKLSRENTKNLMRDWVLKLQTYDSRVFLAALKNSIHLSSKERLSRERLRGTARVNDFETGAHEI